MEQVVSGAQSSHFFAPSANTALIQLPGTQCSGSFLRARARSAALISGSTAVTIEVSDLVLHV